MEHNLSDTIALLTRTPAALNSLLRDLPETWTRQNEATKLGPPTTLSAISSTANAPTGCLA
jgi:hypothetical protein